MKNTIGLPNLIVVYVYVKSMSMALWLVCLLALLQKAQAEVE